MSFGLVSDKIHLFAEGFSSILVGDRRGIKKIADEKRSRALVLEVSEFFDLEM